MITEADSFCTISGVAAYVQRGPFDTTSVPTLDQTLDFMAQRAALVAAIMAQNGAPYTPSTGSNPIPAGQTTLKFMCQQLNAVMASIDVVTAYEVGEAPATSDKVKYLLEIAQTLETALVNYVMSVIADEVAGSTAVATDISSGGVQAAPFPGVNKRAQTIRTFSVDRKDNW